MSAPGHEFSTASKVKTADVNDNTFGPVSRDGRQTQRAWVTSPDVNQRLCESAEGGDRVVVCLFDQLEACGATIVEPALLPQDIVAQIPKLLQDFDRLRCLLECGAQATDDDHLTSSVTPPLA